MDLGLEGRVAWVTGASAGLGRACADALAREGANVAISSRNAERLQRAAEEIASETGRRCVAVPLDISDLDAIDETAAQISEELGPVDILFANPGGGPPPGRFVDLDAAALDSAFRLLVASAWRLTAAVIGPMRERGSGCVIYNTSSSIKEVIPNLVLSNMMRPAIVGMAKTLSKELSPEGIRVLCVAPGRIDTERVAELDRATAERSGRSVEEVRAANEATIALGRYGDPSEFADAVAYLASDRASYLTGISVLIDGGALLGILS